MRKMQRRNGDYNEEMVQNGSGRTLCSNADGSPGSGAGGNDKL